MTLPLWFTRLLFAVEMAVVAALSLVPSSVVPDIGLWDKLQHLLAYAILAATAAMAAPIRLHEGWVGYVLLTSTMIAFGGAIEILQGLVPGRSASISDIIADAVGVLVGLLLARTLMAQKVVTIAE